MTNDLSRGGRGNSGQQAQQKAGEVKDQAQQKAGEVKDQAQQKAGEVKEQVQQKAGEVKEQVQQKAGEVAAKAQEQVTSTLSVQKDSAAQSLTGVAQALRQTSQQLRDQDQVGVTSYIDQAADQVERLSSYIQGNDLGRLVGDVERFARRQPAVFLGGMFLAGLIGARFLKSSQPQPQYDYNRYQGYGYQGGASGYGYQGVYGSGMGGAYTPGYGTTDTYGSTGNTNYGTGEVPGVYRPTGAAEIDRTSVNEPRARSYGEPLEE